MLAAGDSPAVAVAVTVAERDDDDDDGSGFVESPKAPSTTLNGGVRSWQDPPMIPSRCYGYGWILLEWRGFHFRAQAEFPPDFFVCEM